MAAKRSKKDKDADPDVVIPKPTEGSDYLRRLASLRSDQYARRQPVDRHTLASATQRANATKEDLE
ncbi:MULTISPECIES: hypothetical protein [unclassified Rhodococcus (in: high G+C Gram-positive bacteria)]|uniref:hypothetical protein n=1 Tax=unclassified Rhodococcus (in: high G+C Gram-positive bacteria) TaxID=192944 RepID=UPI001140513A|nr:MULTISPECIES: hypothetical protein [unclassified Rhodococcus (in: high G+C Gram-positive bacteria)]